ncbi:hypothetical protein F511_11687 [Dorcoceras hygrometricum]|uniref:DUF1639 family protein n=1 Tax=Dorcoceras hygrometricum TaxID=472368 RepID=A0A2Z7C7Y3_9LAMI|nr:hypothetical protein F511_11687 [Dorcoceras hygrometricum]
MGLILPGHRHHQQSSQLRQTGGGGGGGGEKGSPDSEFVFLGSHHMGSTPPHVKHGGRGIGDVESNGVTNVRENAMFDRRKDPGESKVSIFMEGGEVSVSPQSLTPNPTAMAVGSDINRPWNLRKRRAACKTPASGFVDGVHGAGGKGVMADGAAAVTDKSLRSGGNGCGEKRKREKFSVALSKGEIEEDFLAFTGHRPPRRPKKRAKNVQRGLDTLFPGLWLTEITPELYKVSGAAP